MLRRSNIYRQLESIIGYRFRDRSLLEQAFIHPSYRYENCNVDVDNQRLEFLGDAVLGLMTADYLYKTLPQADEGELTGCRSQLTSGATLASIGQTIGLGEYMKMGRGEKRSGGRERRSNLADAVEALIGAAWIDGGMRAVERIVKTIVLPKLIEKQDGNDAVINPKGKLQEWTQARWKVSPTYTLKTKTGPAHDADFTVEVSLPDGACWVGYGKGKRAAEFDAARSALEELDK